MSKGINPDDFVSFFAATLIIVTANSYKCYYSELEEAARNNGKYRLCFVRYLESMKPSAESDSK